MTYEIIEYADDADRNLFREWFFGLDARAAAKVTAAIARLENGNTSNVESVGGGVYEYKINFGPGYRVYFAYPKFAKNSRAGSIFGSDCPNAPFKHLKSLGAGFS